MAATFSTVGFRTYGFYLLSRTVNRYTCSRTIILKGEYNFPPTGDGFPTRRTRQAGNKSTSSPFPLRWKVADLEGWWDQGSMAKRWQGAVLHRTRSHSHVGPALVGGGNVRAFGSAAAFRDAHRWLQIHLRRQSRRGVVPHERRGRRVHIVSHRCCHQLDGRVTGMSVSCRYKTRCSSAGHDLSFRGTAKKFIILLTTFLCALPWIHGCARDRAPPATRWSTRQRICWQSFEVIPGGQSPTTVTPRVRKRGALL